MAKYAVEMCKLSTYPHTGMHIQWIQKSWMRPLDGISFRVLGMIQGKYKSQKEEAILSVNKVGGYLHY